jgi:hypothetical protein
MPPPSPEQRLESEWRKFLAVHPGTHAVSLAYNNVLKMRPGQLPRVRRIPLEKIHRDLHRLHRDVDRALVGSHLTNLGLQGRRTSFAGFVENPGSNVHAHLIWNVPVHRGNERDEFPHFVEDIWRNLTDRFGTADVLPIRDQGWAFYTAKQQAFAAANDNPELFAFSRSTGR